MPYADPAKQREAMAAIKRRLYHAEGAEGEAFRAAELERKRAHQQEKPELYREATRRYREANLEEQRAKTRERMRKLREKRKAEAAKAE